MATRNDKPTGVELPNEFACKFWGIRDVSAYANRLNMAKSNVDLSSDFEKYDDKENKLPGMTTRQIENYKEKGSPTPTRTGPALVKIKKTGEFKLVRDLGRRPDLYMHPHDIVKAQRKFMSTKEGMQRVKQVLQKLNTVKK